MKLHPAEIAKDFRSYSFFANFGEELILQMAQIAEVQNFSPGQYVLKKGGYNETLYFLKRGRVQIVLDGEVIYDSSTPGEILGEMSAISRMQVSADIRVVEPTELYFIGTKEFSGMQVKDLNEVQFLIYRVYCIILTHRLRTTNEKARQFEIANRELHAAQEELRNLSMKKMDELEKARHFAFEKLQNLSTDILAKLNLEEIVAIYKNEKSIHNKKVLLIDANKKQHVLAKMAFGGSGVKLDLASDVVEADEKLKNSYDMIIFDAQLSDALDLVNKKNNDVPCVLITDADIKNTLNVIKKHSEVHHFISRDVEDRSQTLKFYVTTATKILSRDLFGIEKYLTWGAEKIEKFVASSQQRQSLIEEMVTHFKGIGVRSQVLDRLRISTEEMLMNAIYDAPVDIQGKPLYNHLPRTEVVQLKPAHAATLSYACDGVWLAVSVSDPFGSLKKNIIVDYLESCYAGQAGSLNSQKGGAGRGLHMLIESADLTVFNIESGKRTEVISMINLENVALKKETKSTFHYFKI